MAEGAGAAANPNLIPADVEAVLTLCGFTNDNDRREVLASRRKDRDSGFWHV